MYLHPHESNRSEMGFLQSPPIWLQMASKTIQQREYYIKMRNTFHTIQMERKEIQIIFVFIYDDHHVAAR